MHRASWSAVGGELVLHYRTTDVRGPTTCSNESLTTEAMGNWLRAGDRNARVLVSLSLTDPSIDDCTTVEY